MLGAVIARARGLLFGPRDLPGNGSRVRIGGLRMSGHQFPKVKDDIGAEQRNVHSSQTSTNPLR